ncbi:hypothetical protein G647_00617 [Cladophialophora carrionii CBS 160.54]|uniref:Myb-like domain-containing protein n=1 Tax=Cladophialophora carrionii CBS 160.54 TaxID=1279043 RepID=V9DPC7_9EURO|nr:uncharacterized protein G647_00617 [Cladophialophora carrionii CBS 160.54]ETI28168.1 hypothetical protein G647_00617 [Cladophialophora carrionii CBS 160.54]
MNGITEPLPGLLDDPQFQITDLPALTDFHIAPLRNPAPSRHANIPLPLEPVAGKIHNNSRATKSTVRREDESEKRRAPKITPSDVLLAREAKKPHLAISELLEANDGSDMVPTQLPSFISLSVVEKSPIQAPSPLEHGHAQKRLRLDTDGEAVALEMIRHLPRPAQKEDRPNRPAPLLPAMVTGLHEPPPSAALLPSIDVASRPAAPRSTTTSKIHVKDMLTESDPESAHWRAPPAVVVEKQVPCAHETVATQPTPANANVPATTPSTSCAVPWKDNKPRRARRKWSESETRDLLAGVKKYGMGKWKQILDDPSFNFSERSSVDLKDRYRVCANNDSVPKSETNASTNNPVPEQTAPTEGEGPSLSPMKGTEADSPLEQGHAPKQRRKRRAWTVAEDESLLKGVARHGFQWTAIHDDPELDLAHRRATDLRDRIRNKFPDGYKHAETAPLRSEVKKAEKLAVSSAGTPDIPNPGSAVPAAKNSASVIHNSTPAATPIKTSTPTPTRAASGKVKSSTSASSLTMLLRSDDIDMEPTKEKGDKEKDRERERDQQVGVTLPSFTLEVDDDMDWEDNRLPPLHEWDEIGI